MPVEHDPSPTLQAYAHPGMLVTADWLQAHLDDASLVVVESDEDVLLYETGHIPGSVKVDWHTDLQNPVARDYLDGEGFARLMSEKGIARDHTVVFYGDNFNWWAAYALWVFSLFGHPEVRLLNGGRQKWVADGRPMTTEVPSRPRTEYPVVERDDSRIRAFRDQVLNHIRAKNPLVDVRSPEEYSGEKIHMPEYPQEGALRGGHIPGAASVPWKRAANEDGTFKPLEQLQAIYAEEQGLRPADDIIVYCRIGERSSHTWFVLTHLMDYPNVRNYDGSWTEWGNVVRAPIERPGYPVSPPLE
jgi:thiosulfate/3-mercaptopyruvate sulfurtransferase